VDKPPPAIPGWVYILTNPAMPGLVKIGMTGRTPSQRIAELTRATGVPSPFEVVWSAPVSDCAWVEAAVHRLLADRRVSAGREFFRADVALARKTVEAAAGSLLGRPAPLPRPPSPRLRRKSRRHGHAIESLVIALAVAAIIVIGVTKPAIPAWLPAPMVRALGVVEHLAPAP
jgi:hypothetical protein